MWAYGQDEGWFGNCQSMRWELGGKKIVSCTLIQMSWGGQLPMEIIDSFNRRDKDSCGEGIDESPIVKAPTSIPVAGTRESAKLEERSVRRLSLMRNAQAYDCERLGYRFVKRCFDIVFPLLLLRLLLSRRWFSVLRLPSRVRDARCIARSAWGASVLTVGLVSSPCGNSGACARMRIR